MPQVLEWAGTCRGQITTYVFREVPSGACVLNVTARIEEYWDLNTSAWMDCRELEYEVDGALWVIKKDGKLNQSQAAVLVQHCGWDRKIISFQTQEWKPSKCAFTVEKDTYKDDNGYRISWLNAYNDVPSAGGISAKKAQDLDNRYGGQLQAIAGNVARAAVPPPADAPAVPPPAPASKSSPPAAGDTNVKPEVVDTTVPKEGDDIPF